MRIRSNLPLLSIAMLILLLPGCREDHRTQALRAGQQDRNGELAFAVVGDSRASRSVFPAIIDSINRISPPLVIHLGDLINGYTENLTIVKKQWTVVDRQLSLLETPLLVAPGNHDLYKAKNQGTMAMLELLEKRFNATPLAFEHSSALLLLVNSCLPGEEGRLDDKQLDWLRYRLRQWPKERGPAFLFLHHPLSSPAKRQLFNADAVIELMAGSAVRAVFCSHDHMFHQSRLPGGIMQFITGGGGASLRGLAPKKGGFYHFLTVRLAQGEPLVSVHRVWGVEEPPRPWPPPEYGTQHG